MGLTIQLTEHRYCPVAICDVCDEPVTKYGNVEYLVDEKGRPEEPLTLYVTHKGCSRGLEHRLGRYTYSEELSTYLWRLVHNSEIDLADGEKRARDLAAAGL